MDWIILVLSRYFWFWFNEWIKKLSIACCFVACPSSTKSSTIIQWRPELDKFDMKNVMKTKKSSFIYVRMFAILIHRIGIACTLYETRYPTIRTKKTNLQIVCIHPSAQLIESAKKDFSVYFHPISLLYLALLLSVTLVNVTGKKYTRWTGSLYSHC